MSKNKPIKEEIAETAQILLNSYLRRGGITEVPVSMLKITVEKYLEQIDNESTNRAIDYINELTKKNYRKDDLIDKEDLFLWREINDNEKVLMKKKVYDFFSLDYLDKNESRILPEDEEYPDE